MENFKRQTKNFGRLIFPCDHFEPSFSNFTQVWLEKRAHFQIFQNLQKSRYLQNEAIFSEKIYVISYNLHQF